MKIIASCRLRGLTLIELMVVVVILGIVLAVAIPAFSDLMNKRRVQLIATELSTDLAYARSEAGLRNENTWVWFGGNVSMSCYTVAASISVVGTCTCTNTPGSACDYGQRELRTSQIPTPTGVSIATNAPIKVNINNNNVLNFNKPYRTATPANGVITVQGNRGYTLELHLNAMGRVLTCSPDGRIGGVARC